VVLPPPAERRAVQEGLTMTTSTSIPRALRDRAVPPDPRPDGQDRYTIGEVAEHTGMSVHTLRWYERIGLLPEVDRSHHGQRRFTNADLARLRFIANLRLTGMPVADMVRYAELVREGRQTDPQRAALLTAHRDNVRDQIAQLSAALEVLDFKINIYGDAQASECGVS
jgi:DNA-binding transcriptional MerR regulator